MQGLQTRTRAVLVKHLKRLYPDPNHLDGWQPDKEALLIGYAAARVELNSIWEPITKRHFIWVRQWMVNRIVEDFSKAPLRFLPATSDAAPHQVIAEFSARAHPEKMAFRLAKFDKDWVIIEAWLYPGPEIVDQAGADDFALSYLANTRRITSSHNRDWVMDFLPLPEDDAVFSATGELELQEMQFRFGLRSNIVKLSLGRPGSNFYPDAALAGYYFYSESLSPEIVEVIPGSLNESGNTHVWVRLLDGIFQDQNMIMFSLRNTENGWRLVESPKLYMREWHFEFQKPTGSQFWQYAAPADTR
jgi:hypothetical protein